MRIVAIGGTGVAKEKERDEGQPDGGQAEGLQRPVLGVLGPLEPAGQEASQVVANVEEEEAADGDKVRVRPRRVLTRKRV